MDPLAFIYWLSILLDPDGISSALASHDLGLVRQSLPGEVSAPGLSQGLYSRKLGRQN